MTLKVRHIPLIFISLFVFLFVFALNRTTEETSLRIHNADITVEIADESEEWMLGLSGREDLPEDEGILFVFDEIALHYMWMKDMNFPIDIVWLDEDKSIVWIEENVSPDTYPESFKSSAGSLYVLEVNAGFVEQNSIKLADTVDFSL